MRPSEVTALIHCAPQICFTPQVRRSGTPSRAVVPAFRPYRASSSAFPLVAADVAVKSCPDGPETPLPVFTRKRTSLGRSSPRVSSSNRMRFDELTKSRPFVGYLPAIRAFNRSRMLHRTWFLRCCVRQSAVQAFEMDSDAHPTNMRSARQLFHPSRPSSRCRNSVMNRPRPARPACRLYPQ